MPPSPPFEHQRRSQTGRRGGRRRRRGGEAGAQRRGSAGAADKQGPAPTRAPARLRTSSSCADQGAGVPFPPLKMRLPVCGSAAACGARKPVVSRPRAVTDNGAAESLPPAVLAM